MANSNAVRVIGTTYAPIDMTVQISKGNNKLGLIPSVSLTPIAACAKGVPCNKVCYAMKSYRMYPVVRQAWDKNLYMAINHMDKYFADIQNYLDKKSPEYFRWHVAGDILNQDYFEAMVDLANNNPEIKFLVLTKKFDIDFSNAPANMAIRFSYWSNWATVNEKMNAAWYQDGEETRMSADAFECGGSCTTCKTCWDNDVKEVIFHKH